MPGEHLGLDTFPMWFWVGCNISSEPPLPQQRRDFIFPDSSGSCKEKSLLFDKSWRKRPGKQSREQDNKPASSRATRLSKSSDHVEHTGLSIKISKVCPNPVGAELQHLWAMANPGPVCAKQEIYFCRAVHMCVSVVHVLMISQ